MTPSLTALADLSVKASLVFGSAWIAARALRDRSAAVRHLVWTVAVVAVLLLPAMVAIAPSRAVDGVPAWSVGDWRVGPAGVSVASTPPAASPVNAVVSVVGPEAEPLVGAANPAPPVVPAASPDAPGNGAPESVRAASRDPFGFLPALLTLVWLCGAAWVLARLGGERRRLRRLERGSCRARGGPLHRETARIARRLGVRRPVAVHLSADAPVPLTWGVLVPRVVLPDEAETWPPEELRAVLLHELAHVRRRDTLTQTLAGLACVVHWFNPLAWLAARRMREERERAADDTVLVAGVSAPAYARQLVAFARKLTGVAPREVTAVSVVRTSRLADRIDAVLDRARSRGAPGPVAIGAAVVAGLAAVGLLTAYAPAPPLPATSVEAASSRVGGATPVARGSHGAPSATAADTLPECWREDGDRSLNVHTNDRYREVTRKDDGCTARVRVEGRIGFYRDFDRIVEVPPGSRVVVEEEDAAGSRRFEVRSGPGGRPLFAYLEDGEAVATGAEAELRLRTRLLVLFRYGGVAARERAARILETGGVESALAEARAIPTDPVAAEYLEAALRSRRLSPERLADVAGIVRESVGNDESAARVLATLLETQPDAASDRARDALGGAMASVGSDVAHVELLLAATSADRPELDDLALRSARANVGSDAAMIRFLSEVARRRPALPVDGPPAEAFWRAAATVGSDGEHVRLLRALTSMDGAGAAILVRALGSAEAHIGSDGAMEAYLGWTARNHGPLLSDPGPAAAFRAAMRTIGNDAARGRVASIARRAGADLPTGS